MPTKNFPWLKLAKGHLRWIFVRTDQELRLFYEEVLTTNSLDVALRHQDTSDGMNDVHPLALVRDAVDPVQIRRPKKALRQRQVSDGQEMNANKNFPWLI